MRPVVSPQNQWILFGGTAKAIVVALSFSFAVPFAFAQSHQPSAPQSVSDPSKKPASSQQNTAKKPKPASSAQTLSTQYKEAGMLARLAIEQWYDKVFSESPDEARYREEADRAMTVATARTKSRADNQMQTLLFRLRMLVSHLKRVQIGEKMRLLNERSEELRDSLNSKKHKTETGELSNPYAAAIAMLDAGTQFQKCNTHIDLAFSVGKYIGVGSCDSGDAQGDAPDSSRKAGPN